MMSRCVPVKRDCFLCLPTSNYDVVCTYHRYLLITMMSEFEASHAKGVCLKCKKVRVPTNIPTYSTDCIKCRDVLRCMAEGCTLLMDRSIDNSSYYCAIHLKSATYLKKTGYDEARLDFPELVQSEAPRILNYDSMYYTIWALTPILGKDVARIIAKKLKFN